MNALKLKVGAGLAAGTLAAAGGAMADGGPDVSTVLTVIAAVGVAAASIGVAILGMHYGIKAYKWIRQAG